MKPEDLAILDADPWFRALSAERRTRLAGALQVRAFPRSARVYGAGDPPDGLWVLLEGEVRLGSYSSGGDEVVGLLVRPGRWFGELSVIDGGPRPHDAVVLRPSRLGFASMTAVAELTRQDPELWRGIAVLTCHHARRNLARIERHRFQTAKARLAALLDALVDADAPDAPIHRTQAELANTVGVSRQRLNRLLGEFRADGIVRTTHGAIWVLDRSGLARALRA
jgi:CRP/FNR family transcriptional regulator, cyclic AMP receptor protein